MDKIAEKIVALKLEELGYYVINLNEFSRNHEGSDLLVVTVRGPRLIQVKSSSKTKEVKFGRGSEEILRGRAPFYGEGAFRPHFVASVFKRDAGNLGVNNFSVWVFKTCEAEELIVSAAKKYHEPFGERCDASPNSNWALPLPDIKWREGTRRIRLQTYSERMSKIKKELSENERGGLPDPWVGQKLNAKGPRA